MIKINDRFSIELPPECWNVIEYHNGTNRDGKPTRTARTRYFSGLYQAINFIVDKAPEGANELKEILLRVNQVRDDIYRALTRPMVPDA